MSYQKNFETNPSILRGPSSSLKFWAKIQRKLALISVKILIWPWLLNRSSYWHERAAFQRSVFGWSTASNDAVLGSKNLFSESCLERPKKSEKTDGNSGHYVIASSRPPDRRPLERRSLVPIALSVSNVGKSLLSSYFSFIWLLLDSSHIVTV